MKYNGTYWVSSGRPSESSSARYTASVAPSARAGGLAIAGSGPAGRVSTDAPYLVHYPITPHSPNANLHAIMRDMSPRSTTPSMLSSGDRTVSGSLASPSHRPIPNTISTNTTVL